MTTLSMHPDLSAPPPGLLPYPISLQIGMKRFYGHLFLGPGRLYFICDKQGGALLAAVGQGLGGIVGGAIVAIASPGPGQAPPLVDEQTLIDAVGQREGSMVLEASKITQIKHTLFWRLIKWGGITIGLPEGMSKQLKHAIGPWAALHGVPTKGF